MIQSVNGAGIQQRLASLLLFQDALSDPVGDAFSSLVSLLAAPSQSGTVSASQLLRAYGRLFQAQAALGCAWVEHLVAQILVADNPFTQAAARLEFGQLPAALLAAARSDLRVLQDLAAWDTSRLLAAIQAQVGTVESVPWAVAAAATRSKDITTQLLNLEDWGSGLALLGEHYQQQGVGLFARYTAFRWQGGALVGVAQSDPVRLGDLAGYEQQQDLLVKNTEFLLRGYPALHVLLYGGRGTGKSSLVKALLNQYSPRGLRLVEVAKNDLIDLTAILERLREAPQKFILFVDDLSFETDEHSYTALKVLLEGSLAARPRNVVVYATSNRRHLVREFFADRPRPGAASTLFTSDQADEVHAWDTVQEKLSFSDRFGLTLTFVSPDQPKYLEIVRHLAQQAAIDLPVAELEARALQWATRHNGRSGRSARQFIDFFKAEQTLGREEAPN